MDSNISSFDNCYLVVLDGNRVVKIDANKKPCLRYALRLSRNRSLYVELWYQHTGGRRVLVKYWN